MPADQALPDGRRTRWDTHRAERRRQLVDAGLAVLAASGPEFGLDLVAERAGVTKPVIYRHFTDRARLVDAMGERATAIMLDEWILPAIHHDTAPIARIRASIDAFLGFLEANPNVYWLYVRHAPADGSDVAQMNKELIAAAIGAVLDDFLRIGGIAPDAAEVWGHGLVGFVQNAAEWWLVRRSLSREGLASHLAALVWAQCDGVARSYGVVIEPDVRITPEDLAERLGGSREGERHSAG